MKRRSPPEKVPELERFWVKVDVCGPDECWPWIAATSAQGYGIFRTREGRYVTAHRYAWEATNGKMEAGRYGCHRCDNPPCCNPAHIFNGTPADNMNDAIAKGRRTFENACRGEEVGNSVLTESMVLEIRSSSQPARVFAALYGVAESTVKYARRGETWSHVK